MTPSTLPDLYAEERVAARRARRRVTLRFLLALLTLTWLARPHGVDQ